MKYALLKIILRKEVHMIKFSINMFCKQLVFIDFLFSAQSDDLMPLFEKYGDVGDIYLPLERGTGRSRGFAFVRYSTRFYRVRGGGILRLISKDTTSNVESVCFDLKKCFDLSNLPFFHFLIDTHSFTPVHKKLFKRCTNN